MKKLYSLNVLKVIFVLLLMLLYLYHRQILNNFSFLLGDKTGYDNTIHTSILEHWFNFFRGKSSWSEVGYFYPYKNTIAQTDGYFLTGLIYSFYRIFNLNPYIATEFVGISLKIIGFFGALILSKKIFKFNLNYSLLISVLFSLSNVITAHGYRIQLATVAFAPWLFLLHFKTFESIKNNKSKNFLIYGATSMIFFGLWCITCFYMAWFYAFYLSILLITSFIFIGFNLNALKLKLINFRYHILGILFIGLISIFPFIYAYFPKSLESGTRKYENIKFTTLTLENFFQLGSSNYFYYPFYEKILKFISPNYIPDSWEYYNMGISLLIFILSIFSLIYLFKNKKFSLEQNLIKFITISALICSILIIQIYDFSLWYFIFNFLPGAKALGVVNIFMILLSLPFYISAIYFISKLELSKFLFSIISLILILSELNSPLLELDRKTQSKMNLIIKLPPANCESFYVSGWKDQENFYGIWEWINNQYAHNTSAMMISQLVNLPTLNGMASYIPKEYDLVGPNGTAFSPNSNEYESRIKNYINKFELKNVCRLNLNEKKWTTVN